MFLGIDPSLSSTGLAYTDPATIGKAITVRPGKLRGVERLAKIEEAFSSFLADNYQSVQLAAIESYSYGSIGRLFQLGELGGVLRLALFKADIKFIEVAPTQLKKFATGNPNADKSEIIAVVQNIWNPDVTDDNQADACVLANIAMYFANPDKMLPRHQLEVLHALKNPVVKKQQIKRVIKKSL